MSLKTLSREDIKYLVVHCTATPPQMNIGAKEIDLWHRQRGYFAIGYHRVIRRNGATEYGRALDLDTGRVEAGAHALGFNHLSVGICLVGGVDKAGAEGVPQANYLPEQMATLRDELEALRVLYPNAVILGHRDLPSKHSRLRACPSFDVRAWIAAGMPLEVTTG